MQEFLTLQDKKIPYTRGSVALEKCELDPRNPRIQYLVGQQASGLSDDQLDDLLWTKDPVKALAASIFQNGGVYDPIIVQNSGDKVIVREGNSRLVASRHLATQNPGDARFITLPALIFDVDLSPEDLAVLLADMHVAGKIRWEAYEQAKHVWDLNKVYGKTYEWLSNHLRLSRSKIIELLSAYQATTDFLVVHPEPANIRKFSLFHELMKKKELRDKFSEDLDFKENFQRWVHEDRLAAAIQVRNLPAILASPEATKALDTDGIAEATKILIRDDPALESELFRAVKNATGKLKGMPASDIQDLKAGNTSKIIMLRELHRALQDLATLAGVQL